MIMKRLYRDFTTLGFVSADRVNKGERSLPTMRINEPKLTPATAPVSEDKKVHAAKIGSAKLAGKAAESPGGSPARRTDSDDNVSLSSLSAHVSGLAAGSTDQAEKVGQISELFARGQYTVDAVATGRGIIADSLRG